MMLELAIGVWRPDGRSLLQYADVCLPVVQVISVAAVPSQVRPHHLSQRRSAHSTSLISGTGRATDGPGPAYDSVAPDRVIQLREWGSTIVHKLTCQFSRRSIGNAATCDIQINSDSVAPVHAHLGRTGEDAAARVLTHRPRSALRGSELEPAGQARALGGRFAPRWVSRVRGGMLVTAAVWAGDLREGAKKLKDATPAGVLLGSGTLATELDRLDLIDEYELLVIPRSRATARGCTRMDFQARAGSS